MKPEWLKVKSSSSENRQHVEGLLARLSLHTVCEEASCPNLMECFSRKTATFMILGRNCTRNCTFCDVARGCTDNVDPEEPQRIAKACIELGLRHVVVTSVTRDDLPDGGADHFAQVIKSIHAVNPNLYVEVLIPDFQGDNLALQVVLDAKPHILNHNIETIERLYPDVRPMAQYSRSLELLKNAKNMAPDIFTKSGIMVGLGEKPNEVIESLSHLKESGCDFLTIGQYLSPSKKHHPVIEYVHPDIFNFYKEKALEMGFRHVASAPLVRSSYMADKAMDTVEISKYI